MTKYKVLITFFRKNSDSFLSHLEGMLMLMTECDEQKMPQDIKKIKKMINYIQRIRMISRPPPTVPSLDNTKED